MTAELWKTSGHWDHYRDNMFVIEHEERDTLCLKPMNCPGHAALFATTKRSYRELPLRFAEYSKLHRDERAGVTHGILRTRTFSQDDGHIFCSESQIAEEALKGIAFTFRVYDLFGFKDVELKLATRPEKFLGTPETWDKAEKALEDSLRTFGRPFTIVEGEGAFYGPKIEFHIKDSLKRTWQCGTIQLDFGLPERFQLEFVDSDGKSHRPVMIHRAVLGSIERFFGILVEHHNGHFPFWISPVQALVLNVTSDQEAYVKEIAESLKAMGLRVETDLRNEKLGYKIREAQLQRVPLMLVLGNKEKDSRTLSVRKATGETLNDLTLEGFKKLIEPLLLPGGEAH
jgi:threonyl-tRNA synthetase